MKRFAVLLILSCMLLSVVFGPRAEAASGCTVCILEIQVQGAHGEEDQDFVVLANLSGATITASSTSPIRLQYYNDQGVAGPSVAVATSSILNGQVYVLASSTVTPINAAATALNLPLYSGGGSLQLMRTTSTSTTVYDKVGWGSAVTAEGASAPAPPAGMTLARRNIKGVVQDTNDNSQDFGVHDLGCKVVGITEVQPFVVDGKGQSIDAWVEAITSPDDLGDCLLLTKAGDMYAIPGESFLGDGQASVISRGIDSSGQVVPLHLGEVSGQVWLAATSEYAGVRLPVATQGYNNLEYGQSHALIDGIWRSTFSPTPGGENVYSASAELEDDPTMCSMVRISELLPNPTGEDSGREWLEISNESDGPVSLGNCIVTIAGVEYRFLPDDALSAREWRAVYDFYDQDRKLKPLALRNSGATLVAFQRLKADGTTETLQSFEYTDALEGQSWARFIDGWRWLTVPTPNLDNSTALPEGSPEGPTEFPATDETPSSSQTPIPNTNTRVSITELLPNPAAPGTDDHDEFVELFNAGTELVALRGYKLQTGNSYNYSFIFTDQTISPNGYLTITSGESSISLANSGGRARLVDPDGAVVYETAPYMDAPEGNAWGFFAGTWKWTASPTPGSENALKEPVLTALTKSKAPTTKTSSAVKSASKTSTASTKVPKISPVSSTKPDSANGQQIVTVPPLHPLILAVVGGLGVLYAAYEYRQDVANKIYQFRRYRKSRRTNRASFEGRGVDRASK